MIWAFIVEIPLEPTGWPEDAIYDALVKDWSIYQRENGHKTSTDDVLTAWYAAENMGYRAPERYLDLGCGIGSVLLLTSHALRPRFSLGIEAQTQSALMAQKSVAQLPTDLAIEVRHSDFRSAVDGDLSGTFDLVTGSPPYFPVGTGTMSKDYQRSACRFELRGGVEAYCAAAADAMSETGIFILVHQTEWNERVLKVADQTNLELQSQLNVLMREDRDRPFLSVYCFGKTKATPTYDGFAIRTASGKITERYKNARAQIDLTTVE